MPTELLNISELNQIVASTPYEASHGPLLDALASRYPGTLFKLIAERTGRTWDVGILGTNGVRVTDNLGAWVDQEIVASNGNAREVWDRHKYSGLIRTERVGGVIYLVAPYGTDPDAFFQLEILAGPELATQLLFDPKTMFPPEDRFDLISGSSIVFGDDERQALLPPKYQFDKLTNVRSFLRQLVEGEKAYRQIELPEMKRKTVNVHEIFIGEEVSQTSKEVPFLDLDPNWIDRLPPAVRLFHDWAESSAGRAGHRFCDHWWVQTSSWNEKDGQRRFSLIPQWADADGGLSLPKISPDWEASPYGVMEQLQQFDRQAGYPMAWYFYALHGNRISHSAAGIIANAIRDGLLHLSTHDDKVLLKWRNEQYGF